MENHPSKWGLFCFVDISQAAQNAILCHGYVLITLGRYKDTKIEQEIHPSVIWMHNVREPPTPLRKATLFMM